MCLVPQVGYCSDVDRKWMKTDNGKRRTEENLTKKREEAIALSGLEVYNRYMTFFPSAWMFFQQDEAKLHRIVMEK